MKALQNMKTVKTVLLAAGIAMTLACGYSHSMTPASAGNMPTISNLSPNSAAHGDASFPLTITGTNFNSNAVINFNGTAMSGSGPVTGFSGTEVRAMIPASAIMNAGTVQVTVTNPGTPGGVYGGGTTAETSAPMTFTIN
jgi:hypothetical protein